MKRRARNPTPAGIKFSTPWAHEARASGGRPLPLTDMGNAERLVIAHGDNLRFLHGTRQWHVWDGRRFAVDQRAEAKRLAKQTARAMLLEAHLQDNDDQRRQLIAHQIRSESDRAVRAMLALAECDEKIAARASDFDRDMMLFNVLNGTLDLQTGELREHNRRDLITKLAPVAFDASAIAPTWERFLLEIMDSDAEKISFVRRAVGYTLTGNVSEHCFFLLHGTGANGKSTFLEVLRELFGDYATQSDFSTFLATKGAAIRNDIARLRGARLVTAVESDAGRRLAENVVKHMTGGDTVAARFLYSEHFEFVPTFKLWLATNNRPRIVGTDEAIWRRVRLIPFTVTIPEKSRDSTLADKLRGELTGVLNWALIGLEEWRKYGLAAPRAITQASADYRAREDSVGEFVNDYIIFDVETEVRASELFRAYSDWAEKTGEYRLREKQFSESLEQRGFIKHRKAAGNFWKGIRM
jgi:putative DNA primase/helicase